MNSAPEYNNRSKNRWRNRTWKDIATRLKNNGVAVCDAVGLYLPSSCDYDRRIAVQRYGFRPYNLIGVDYKIDVCKRMRKRGNICIHGELQNVVDSWPAKSKIDFIVADYCCGLSDRVKPLAAALLENKWLNRKTPLVVSVNMQRGRDKESNNLRSVVPFDLNTLRYHRGAQFAWLLSWIAIDMFGISDIDAWKVLNFKFDSYKPPGRKPRMDSVIFDWALKSGDKSLPPTIGTLTNNIKAALAVRSMKINGNARQAAVA